MIFPRGLAYLTLRGVGAHQICTHANKIPNYEQDRIAPKLLAGHQML